MSQAQEYAARQKALAACTQAIVGLTMAGAALVRGREATPAAGQELIDALRDDITGMVGDIEALQDVIHGR